MKDIGIIVIHVTDVTVVAVTQDLAALPDASNAAVPPPAESKVLGVFGLSLRTRERDLEELFDEFGKHERVTIVYDHRTDRSRGFGFVYFEHEEDAARAKEKTNGLELHGRRIRVDFSMTQRPHSPTPGQYMGRKTERTSRRRSRSKSWSRSRSRGRSYSR
ncbi:RNA-binding domain-containing protein [Basidiobolus meristosporus CBS 931.73]|uniref:RNA-binding domain-containing protein n=1 Tax=Basidiobolus meristosporus CBS 931.73 TaxID=1314790 RepID=A0A1Y1VSP2_9FUNG|nr:RNA-binding domain-containing protein [Basidiobolus meristosporus CBS 931.73]|eukprot:ORX64045.1 RNA-binding domain-containing protein [Basidiobolus meristosporus CBS 931.73]